MFRRPPAAPAEKITRQAACLLIQALDTLNGQRPLYALRALCTPDAYRDLTHLVDELSFKRARIGSVGARHLNPTVVEAHALVTVGKRTHAATVSLRERTKWRVEHIHVLGISPRNP